LPIRAVLFAAALAAGSLAAPAAAATRATPNYIVTLAGANIATVAVSLDDDGQRYSLDLSADVTGLGQLVANGTASIDSAGVLAPGALTSQKFALLTRANGEDFRVRVEFSGADVTAFVVDPPLLDDAGRVALERKDLHGVNDMLAAFVLRADKLDAAVCQRQMHIFTGLERFDVNMRYAAADVATSKRTGYQGPVVLCTIRYVPVSGHFTNSEITSFLAGSDRILIWYAPLGATGYVIPYRVLIATSVGDLSMVLTAMGT
jgi:hypothetical protein